MRGTVKFFNATKGYGFITVEGEKDVFVHYEGIKSDGFRTLEKDQEVTFDTQQGDKGLMAVNVEVIK
ncbi:MAG: cold shock domain-containing protein [Coprobacillus sp.]